MAKTKAVEILTHLEIQYYLNDEFLNVFSFHLMIKYHLSNLSVPAIIKFHVTAMLCSQIVLRLLPGFEIRAVP